ncbi:MAG: MBL fold metallo-hydrolase [Desulfobacterales bacterium]|nr:MBL fold metallo-hydrolase [Desulfobacterales bacterium]
MNIQWLGTAGFKIQTAAASFLTDPYLSRNSRALPRQPLAPEDLAPVSHIFISHGHFDHLMDVPAIARHTGARVICSPTAAHTLADMGLGPDRVIPVGKDGFEISFSGVRARAFYSRHVRFDLRLLLTTLIRTGREIPEILPLFLKFPCGQVLSWRFEAEGKTVHFFGSCGSTDRELNALASHPLDILLLPLQGHSRICDLGFHYVRVLNPGLVIPHHQDDFFPPVSRTVDINPFTDLVKGGCPRTRTRVMAVNEVLSL